jgi:Ca2+-binding RTX toxin-like protein
MIIQAKATKESPAQTDPAQRYTLKNTEKKSKTPYILGLMFTSLLVYLKSMFPSLGQQDEDAEAAAATDATDMVPETLSVAEQLPPGLDPEPTGTTPPQAVGSGRALVELQAPAEFMLIESPVVEFMVSEPGIGFADFSQFGVGRRATNDNNDTGIGIPPEPVRPVIPGPVTPPPDGPGDPDDPGDTDGGDPDGPGDPDDPSDPPGDGDEDHECPHECNGTSDCDEEEEANRAPRVSGPVYLMDVSGCAILAIGLADLLRNAVDPDGDELSVRNLSISSGNLTASAEGWIFQGGPQLQGLVTITYQVTDGELSVDQTAYFSVLRNRIEGTCEADIIVGTMCADEIDGMEGSDNIDARAGHDIVSGGAGNDHIVAGAGDDVVFAGSGNDIVFGGDGDDHVSGGSGDDRLFGEQGDDIIFGEAGDDSLSGGKGDDILDGGEGDDALEGGEGNDVLTGGAGRDLVKAGAGDDVIVDGYGEDKNLGGGGDDHVIAALDDSDDHHDGGDGRDTLDYSRTTQGVELDLVEGEARGAEIATDAIACFEAVIGGAGDDRITIDDAVAMVLTGGEGDDIFEFASSQEHAPTTHTILDFEVGDRIRMSKYDLFEKMLDELEDQFEAIYGDDIDEDDIPIRYRHDRTDELNRTLVEADFNDDDVWETTIVLDGHRVLVVVEHA